MNRKLLLEASDLFDTSEKWIAFNELTNQKTNLMNLWWKKLQNTIYDSEQKKGHPDWGLISYNAWDLRWFLKEYGAESFCVHFWGRTLRVTWWNDLDVAKVKETLPLSRFDPIRNAFGRVSTANEEQITEEGNFSFGDYRDGCFESTDDLAWYAGNRTEAFAEQIIGKVRAFQTPEIAELIKEINEKCKIG